MSEHSVLFATHYIGPAVCACGWESAAEAGPERLAETDAHMHAHYLVFVQCEDEHGVLVSDGGYPPCSD